MRCSVTRLLGSTMGQFGFEDSIVSSSPVKLVQPMLLGIDNPLTRDAKSAVRLRVLEVARRDSTGFQGVAQVIEITIREVHLEGLHVQLVGGGQSRIAHRAMWGEAKEQRGAAVDLQSSALRPVSFFTMSTDKLLPSSLSLHFAQLLSPLSRISALAPNQTLRLTIHSGQREQIVKEPIAALVHVERQRKRIEGSNVGSWRPRRLMLLLLLLLLRSVPH